MRGEAASSTNYSEMIESSGKRRKGCVDHPKDRSKPTCLAHGPGHSSYGCNALGEFVSKHSKSRPTKDRGHDPVDKLLNRNQENSYIVQNAVDWIILKENNKLSAKDEAHGKLILE